MIKSQEIKYIRSDGTFSEFVVKPAGHDKETKYAVQLSKLLKKLVIKDFGRCKDYNFGCVVCQANRVVKECEQLAALLRDNK